MKKKILVIAPLSYPVTGAESIVNMNLLRALTESERFEIDLISKKRKWDIYPSDTIDNYHVKLNKLSIIQVDNKITFQTLFQTLLSFITFGVAFAGSHWAYKALKVAKQFVAETQYDYVLTKSSPSMLVGWYLKRKYQLKWIGSWNDPYPDSKYPAPYGKGGDYNGNYTDRKLIKMMRYADAHVFPSQMLQEYMRSYLDVPLASCFVVPHTVLERTSERTAHKDRVLRLVHAGNLGKYRNATPLIRALAQVLAESSLITIKITFIGIHSDSLVEEARKEGVSDNIEFLPSVEYNKCLAMMKDYDVAVIIEAPVKKGIFLPTKVGDYVSVGIPILSISPQIGVLHDMYGKGEISYYAEVDNVNSIKMTLTEIIKDYEANSLKTSSMQLNQIRDTAVETYWSF